MNYSDHAIVRTFCGEFSDIQHLEQEIHPDSRLMLLAAVNVLETGASYVFEMALPGYQRQTLRLQLEDDVLTVYARAPYPRHKDVRRLYKQEFAAGDFSRSFLLPEDAGKATAQLADGVLTIRFRKGGEALPSTQQKIFIPIE